MLPTEDSLPTERHTQAESKGKKNVISCKWKFKKLGQQQLFDKIDFKTKAIE